MKKINYFVLTMTILAGLSCSQNSATVPPPETGEAHIEVSVYESGKISVDGEDVNLDELAIKLDDLATRNGTVWYYREQSAQTPHKSATEVLRLVIERRLPITMSSKPDFSDYVDKDGGLRKRSEP